VFKFVKNKFHEYGEKREELKRAREEAANVVSRLDEMKDILAPELKIKIESFDINNASPDLCSYFNNLDDEVILEGTKDVLGAMIMSKEYMEEYDYLDHDMKLVMDEYAAKEQNVEFCRYFLNVVDHDQQLKNARINRYALDIVRVLERHAVVLDHYIYEKTASFPKEQLDSSKSLFFTEKFDYCSVREYILNCLSSFIQNKSNLFEFTSNHTRILHDYHFTTQTGGSIFSCEIKVEDLSDSEKECLKLIYCTMFICDEESLGDYFTAIQHILCSIVYANPKSELSIMGEEYIESADTMIEAASFISSDEAYLKTIKISQQLIEKYPDSKFTPHIIRILKENNWC